MNMRPETMAKAFESCNTARLNCEKNNGDENSRVWELRWCKRLNKLVELIPSGSGIDVTPRTWRSVDISPREIRFDVEFHHMNDGGFYDGWTTHTIVVRPSFDGVSVSVSGRNRRDVKDHLHEVMEYAFTRHVTWDEERQGWIVESDEDRAFNAQLPGFDRVAEAVTAVAASKAVDVLESFEPIDCEACDRFRAAIATVRSVLGGVS